LRAPLGTDLWKGANIDGQKIIRRLRRFAVIDALSWLFNNRFRSGSTGRARIGKTAAGTSLDSQVAVENSERPAQYRSVNRWITMRYPVGPPSRFTQFAM
jgi:hypothetical protein